MEQGVGRIDWRAMRRTFAAPVVRQSVLVARVVGAILNAINQGPEILAGKSVNVLRLVLTFAVPFFVASYGAYSAFRRVDTIYDRND